MPCNDLAGGQPWFNGVLVKENTEEIVGVDPPLRFFVDNNQLFARFAQNDRFPVTCAEESDRRRLRFTRTVGNETTVYNGVAAPIAGRAVFYMVRGTFERTTVAANGTKTVVKGDWETERPT